MCSDQSILTPIMHSCVIDTWVEFHAHHVSQVREPLVQLIADDTVTNTLRLGRAECLPHPRGHYRCFDRRTSHLLSSPSTAAVCAVGPFSRPMFSQLIYSDDLRSTKHIIQRLQRNTVNNGALTVYALFPRLSGNKSLIHISAQNSVHRYFGVGKMKITSFCGP